MKKIAKFILVVVMVVGLVGCSGDSWKSVSEIRESPLNTQTPEVNENQSEEKPRVHQAPDPTPTPVQIPTVTYDEIMSGAYNEQKVYINCAISNMSKGATDYVEFDSWVHNGSEYVYSRHWLVFDIKGKPSLSMLEQAIDGEIYKFCITVNKDSSFGGTSIESCEKIEDTVDIAHLEQQYKDTCKAYTCEELLRNPEKFKGEQIQISGEVLQVASDDGSNVEFLLDTGKENGISYIKYSRSEDEDRILDGDSITAYGTFYKLTKYTSVLGAEKTVPELYANFLDINN